MGDGVCLLKWLEGKLEGGWVCCGGSGWGSYRIDEFRAGRVELNPGGGSCGKADAVDEAEDASGGWFCACCWCAGVGAEMSKMLCGRWYPCSS